jgi:hypothetical protein
VSRELAGAFTCAVTREAIAVQVVGRCRGHGSLAAMPLAPKEEKPMAKSRAVESVGLVGTGKSVRKFEVL